MTRFTEALLWSAVILPVRYMLAPQPMQLAATGIWILALVAIHLGRCLRERRP